MELFYRFQLGDFNCMVLRDNWATMPLSVIFPNVPVDQMQAALDVYGIETQEVAVGYDVLFIDTGAKKVLVDSGLPQSRNGKLLESMKAADLDPADIETIIVTHGDGDHIGGLSHFPDARLVMPKNSWDVWTDPTKRADMVEEFVKLFRNKLSEAELAQRQAGREPYGSKVLPSLRDRIDFAEAETEFLPGFKLISAPGHRTDHMAVEIHSAGETLIHVVDSLRHPVQFLNPDWPSFIDSYPDLIVKTNKMLIDRAVEKSALVFGSHITFPGLGRLIETANGQMWQAIER